MQLFVELPGVVLLPELSGRELYSPYLGPMVLRLFIWRITSNPLVMFLGVK